MKVLVLDDDPDDAFLIASAIEDINEASYAVSVVYAPEQARQQLQTESFDIILCDYRLGAISGVEFITDIRHDGSDVPVILLTGMEDRATDQAALAAGAADYICKSDFTPELIDRAIRYATANTRRQRLITTVLSSVNAAICVIDVTQQPILWNPKFADLAKLLKPDVELLEAICNLCNETRSPIDVHTIEDRILDKTIAKLEDGRCVVTLHDVTEHVQALEERQRAETRAAHLARHCSLTGLPNRNAFAERISEEIEKATRQNSEFYLLILDLDRFKEINDVFGHHVGDQLLIMVAERLKSCCSDDSYLARLGGDEFVAIQPKRPGDGPVPPLANSFLDAVGGSFTLTEKVVHTGISVGVAIFPDHGMTTQELLSNADIAMYRAKAGPSSGIQAYNSKLDEVIRERRVLASELKKAVEQDAIDVYFQPQARVIDGQISGFEALARWNHPEHGLVSPSLFVPIAEENGLIEQIGRSVLKRSCKYAADWPIPANVSVNISGVQIRHTDLVPMIHATLFETGLNAQRLELEVTESVLIDDFETALKVLRGIKNLGVSLAMDDFGTGYSSLSSLIAFPFDKLKIDRSFVMDLGHKQQLSAIVRAIISLGKNLGLRIIAEGVEKPSHIDFLAGEKCDEMQGFLIGRPMTNDDVVALLNSSTDGSSIAPAQAGLSAA